MSADKPPLLCEVRFGALHPVNTAARDAIKAIPPGPVRIEIKRTRANEARRGFYWVMLDVAAEAMTDSTGFPFDQAWLGSDLHHAERSHDLQAAKHEQPGDDRTGARPLD